MASKILINLCSSLAATYLIFLVGLQGYGTKITAVCKVSEETVKPEYILSDIKHYE